MDGQLLYILAGPVIFLRFGYACEASGTEAVCIVFCQPFQRLLSQGVLLAPATLNRGAAGKFNLAF